MPYMTITDDGYALIQEALRQGIRIQPDAFSVGSSNERLPFSEKSELEGAVLYSGEISEAHLLNDDTATFTCLIPPDSVTGLVGELALYSGATLFAIGRLDQTYQKLMGFGLRMYAFVQALGIGKAIDPNYSVSTPLSKAITYNDVGTPDSASRSSVLVLDGHKCSTSEKGPVILVKSSTVDQSAQWNMLCGTKLYSAKPSAYSTTTFTFPLEDFNAIGYDLAYAQVIAGTGIGQIRSVTYNVTTNTYTVGSAWSVALADDSVVELWAAAGFSAGTFNNDCDDTLSFDTIDPSDTPLVDPDPLCQGQTTATRAKSSRQDVSIKKGVSTTDIKLVMNWGIHFSDWPIAAPFDENDTVDTGLGNLKQRLIELSPLYGKDAYEQVFSPTRIRIDSGSTYYTPAFEDESLIVDNTKTKAYVIKPIKTGDNSVVNQTRSDRVLEGNYPDMENVLVSSVGQITGVKKRTLDSILIPEGYRLIVYENKNFTGRVFLDVTGPIYIVNSTFFATSTSLQNAAANVVLNTKSARNPQLFFWVLDDAAWRGQVGIAIPKAVRFKSTDRMLTTSGQDQATPTLVEPNLAMWRGSFRVINMQRL